MNLIIIEKYEAFLNYIYPIAQNMPRKHGALRDLVLRTAISQVDLFYRAVKSSQKSKLYEADAGLATLRFLMRICTSKKLMTPHQHQVASIKIAEVGGILNSWIAKG